MILLAYFRACAEALTAGLLTLTMLALVALPIYVFAELTYFLARLMGAA